MARYYDKPVAERYDAFRGWHDSIPRKIAQIIDCKSASLCLDIGCGTGNLSSAVGEACSANFIGVDLSIEMIRKASEKAASARFAVGDCARLPFETSSFDAVIGSFFIHHVISEDRPRMIEECFRVLSKGRVAIVTRSHEQIESSHVAAFFPDIVDVDGKRFPRISEIQEWFRAAGFEGIGSETVMDRPTEIDQRFLRSVENKVISTLDMIPKESFEIGLQTLRDFIESTKGKPKLWEMPYTLVYAEKR